MLLWQIQIGFSRGLIKLPSPKVVDLVLIAEKKQRLYLDTNVEWQLGHPHCCAGVHPIVTEYFKKEL